MAPGNRKIQYLIAYAVSFAAVASGAFSTWPAPVMPKFHNNETNIDITPNQIAWMVSMSSPGFMSGSLAVRFLADRIGRRLTLIMSALPFAIGTVMVATAIQAWLLYLTRFLWGFAAGMFATVASVYLAELADKEIRGAVTLVSRYMFNFGNLLMMCIGPFVSYTTLNYLLLVLPIVHLIGCLWIPETPYFLLKEGKVDAARKVLLKIRVYEDDEKLLEDDLLKLKADVRNEMRYSSTLKELFTGKKYRKPIVIATGLKSAQLLTGQLIVSQYLGIIMLESETSISLTSIFIIFGVVRFVSSVTSSVLADRVGRRPLLIYSYLGTGICMLIIGIYFFCKEVLQFSGESLRPFNFIPFAGVIAGNIISTLGYYSLIVVVPAEIFPLNIKTIAMTCLSIFGGLMNFAEARGYQAMKDAAGLCGVFWFLGVSGLAGAIFTVLYVPETKGKSLREIQELLQGDLYESDEVIEKLNTGNNNIDVKKDASENRELLEVKKRISIVKSL